MEQSKKYWVSTDEGIPIETRTILNEYLLSIKLANKSETTISRYRSILERFFLACLIPISELTSEDVLKWLQAYSVGKVLGARHRNNSDNRVQIKSLIFSEVKGFFYAFRCYPNCCE